MEIDVTYELEGGTAAVKGTLNKEEVEFAVKYGLLHMIQNGVIGPQQDVLVVGESNGSVN